VSFSPQTGTYVEKELEAMQTYETTIATADLTKLVEEENVVVFDTRFSLADTAQGRRIYMQDHIQKAQYAHLDEDLSGELTTSGGRHPLPDVSKLCDFLRKSGVNKNSQIVAYDDSSGAIASRLWWLCKWLRHDAVAVLDGGYDAWLSQELPTSKVEPVDVPEGNFEPKLREDLVLSAADVERQMTNESLVLVDAREAARFRGEFEPIDPVAGHVPGAINFPFQDNISERSHFKTDLELFELYQSLKSEQNVAVMCGSSVTACHNILAMRLAGLQMPRLYAGSWSDWLSDGQRPTATGH
jgi:thiosulfate/3-mercaptopyruvate sulfurtransferase